MSASSLPQIDGFAASNLGFLDGLRSMTNGLVCWRIVSPRGDSSCDDILLGVAGKPANVLAQLKRWGMMAQIGMAQDVVCP